MAPYAGMRARRRRQPRLTLSILDHVPQAEVDGPSTVRNYFGGDRFPEGNVMTARDTALFLAFAALSIGWAVLQPTDSPAAICRAYLDPSTGAMIISAIVGIAATLALGAKTFWYKLTAPFRRKKPAEPSGR